MRLAKKSLKGSKKMEQLECLFLSSHVDIYGVGETWKGPPLLMHWKLSCTKSIKEGKWRDNIKPNLQP